MCTVSTKYTRLEYLVPGTTVVCPQFYASVYSCKSGTKTRTMYTCDVLVLELVLRSMLSRKDCRIISSFYYKYYVAYA